MTAYTDATKIAAYLGVTLTAPQIVQAGVLAQAASDWIDRYTGKTWQATSPVTDEMHTLARDRVYLNSRPVATITTVKTRAAAFVGFGWTTLAASQYELLDGANGVLLIRGWSASSDELVQVTYTHTTNPAPSVIGLAASMIAAAWLSQSMRPNTQGVDSISVGQGDIQVKFAASRGNVPQEALAILNGYRSVVIA